MSDEVMAAQHKGRKRIMILAAFTAGVGGLLGYAIGNGTARASSAEVALEGASTLQGEVKTANQKIEELVEVLKSAKSKLKEGKYPKEEVSKLGGINIPFEGINLTGKGIGRFKPDLVNLLIKYTSGVEVANEQRELLQRLLSREKAISEFLSQNDKPKVRWAVLVTRGPQGPWAEMQPLPKPFRVAMEKKENDGKDYSWPSEIELRDGKKMVEIKRYTRGSPTGSSPEVIPVDPGTQGSVCSSDVVTKLSRELTDMETLLRGERTPGYEKDGLLDMGRALAEKLGRIGGPGV